MNEKDLLNQLKRDADSITPPASLQPDAIEEMLLRSKECTNDKADDKTVSEINGSKKKNRRKFYRFATRYGSMAAICALVLTVAWQAGELSKYRNHLEAEVAADSTAHTKSSEEEVTEKSEKSETDAPEKITERMEMSAAIPKKPVPKDTLTYANSYEEIFDALHNQFSYDTDLFHDAGAAPDTVFGMSAASGAAPMARFSEAEATSLDFAAAENTDSAFRSSSADQKDFSETNRQEDGVDEADIVKTDGEYIYILRSDGSFAILKAAGADSDVVSVTKPDTKNDNPYTCDLYLDGDILNVITGESTTQLQEDGELYYSRQTQQTVVYTYDISDRSAPVLTGTVTQEGSYADSRKVGSHLYLFTAYWPDIRSTYEDSTIVPLINGIQPRASDFYLPKTLENASYLVISSVDTARPDQIQDSKILVSGESRFYVSPENIYIANTDYASQTSTVITKFHYEDGNITGVAAGSVKGFLNDSFSMNEYNGNLRIVSTYFGDETKPLRDSIERLTGLDLSVSSDRKERNALFILDESMKQIGRIDDLARGETIRSARFFGDTGYFVTFRQTDPLFSADLSDPENPKILGELKISGFSSYLHFYGENLLLGIGFEADETTGRTSGLKLSMFDISDPSNVIEQNRFVIPGITWCPSINSYKSILVDPSKNLIGFYHDSRYLTFSYDPEKGFSQELVYDFYSDMLVGQADHTNMRGLFVRDDFYLAGENFLAVFDMKNGFEKTGILKNFDMK